MKLKVVPDYQELSRLAASIVQGAVNKNPESVLVLPTGNTPLGMYKELVDLTEQGLVDFTNCKLIELDEYHGIPFDDVRSLFGWLNRIFISKVGIKSHNITRFNSIAPDSRAECDRIERIIEHLGGIDLLVLGLGENGHLGFNEPGSSFDSTTHVVELSPTSISSNARYWSNNEEVPPYGMTLGLKTLSSSRQTLLLVSGRNKSSILPKVLNTPLTSQIPATVLQQFRQVTVIADRLAASSL